MPSLMDFNLEIDASELDEEINRLRSVMTPKQFDRAMYGIFQRTGRHVSKILKDELPKQYYVKPRAIGDAVKNAKVTTGAGGVGCSIPVVAPRINIGSGFSASGGAKGWNNVKYKRKYRVKARIVKTGQSTLPAKADSYGDQPPFRNLGSKLGGLTFTRKGESRGPILKMSGIAIPQMPMNRSKEDVERDIIDYMKERMEARFQALIANGR